MEHPKFSFDVFLSHNSKDKPQVIRLAERLRAAGVRVWLDEWIIKPGDDIYLAIERGLETSRTLILCMSPNAFGSEWVGLERSTVLFRNPSNADRRFIPLMLADCEPPDTLRRFKYVDFRTEAEAAFEELLAVCLAAKDKVPDVQSPNKSAATGSSRLAKPLPDKSIKDSTTSQSKSGKKPKDKNIRPVKPAEASQPLAVLEHKLKGHNACVYSVAISPDGTWLASGSDDYTVKIWDIKTGACLATLEGHTDNVYSLAITPDGKTLFSGSQDETIRRWLIDTRETAAVLQEHHHSVLGLVVFDDGARLASCSGNEDPPTIRLWDTATNKLLRVIKDEGNAVVWSIAVSRNGDRLVSGGADNKVKIWNVANGERLMALEGHSDSVNSVQITPDGQFAISGSDDKTVKIWNLEMNTCIGTLEGHQGVVHSVALSPDGSLIASVGFIDYTVRLWDRNSGTCLQVIENEEMFTPFSVAFSPDGSRLVVG
ncbi:MAG: TIR domain-containing protein, partial [Methylococcaceae bacterium]|nr:TIR domain-containing protein [Methylococcaceae bacterium]